MNRFKPAYRQIELVFERLAIRGRLVLARRKLAQQETELGLLGWQQAEYSGATQHQVRQLSDYEREQSRLMSESGELGLAIHEFTQKREKERAEFAERNAEFQTSLSDLAKPIRGLEQRIAKRRKTLEAAERKVAELEAELGIEAKADDPLEVRARMKAQFQEVPNKLRIARSKLAAIREEIRSDENDLNLNSPVLKALNDRLNENRAQFETQDTALKNEIANRVRAKRKLEKEIETLEKAKAHPYREIGRVLADCKIAPMNQPHALENVHSQRLYIDALEFSLVKSFAESRSQSKEAILMSWQWWVALFGGISMAWILIWVIWEIAHFLFFRH